MLYEYQCLVCTQRVEAYRKLAERLQTPACPRCGGDTEQRIFSAPPAVVAPPLSYYCVASGQPVDTWKKRKRIMDERGLMDAREFGDPDWDALDEERTRDLKLADDGNLPDDLKRAMREQKLDIMPELRV